MAKSFPRQMGGNSCVLDGSSWPLYLELFAGFDGVAFAFTDPCFTGVSVELGDFGGNCEGKRQTYYSFFSKLREQELMQ